MNFILGFILFMVVYLVAGLMFDGIYSASSNNTPSLTNDFREDIVLFWPLYLAFYSLVSIMLMFRLSGYHVGRVGIKLYNLLLRDPSDGK